MLEVAYINMKCVLHIIHYMKIVFINDAIGSFSDMKEIHI